MESRVLIMMATYNGGRYITEQIDSILNQTYENWNLMISDDGSSDITLELVESYAQRDTRILPVIHHKSNYGASANFYHLLDKAKNLSDKYDYYFFSDQDDIWDCAKIKKQVSILECERGIAACYSDLMIMTGGGDIVGKMSDIQNIRMRKQEDIFFNQIYIWGNTLAFNKQLLNYMFVPENRARKISHDHYVGFYGCAFGKVTYINEPLVKYRRYGTNVSELPHKYDFGKIMNRIKRIKQLVNKHAANYAGILYFIKHAPRETSTLIEIKECYEYGGIKSLRIIKKLGVIGGSNQWNSVAKRLILLSRIYQKSVEFRLYM